MLDVFAWNWTCCFLTWLAISDALLARWTSRVSALTCIPFPLISVSRSLLYSFCRKWNTQLVLYSHFICVKKMWCHFDNRTSSFGIKLGPYFFIFAVEQERFLTWGRHDMKWLVHKSSGSFCLPSWIQKKNRERWEDILYFNIISLINPVVNI
jgi:hypothetical protein